MTQQAKSDDVKLLDKAWEAVNALGGYHKDTLYNAGQEDAIDAALRAIEKLGGRDPLTRTPTPAPIEHALDPRNWPEPSKDAKPISLPAEAAPMEENDFAARRIGESGIAPAPVVAPTSVLAGREAMMPTLQLSPQGIDVGELPADAPLEGEELRRFDDLGGKPAEPSPQGIDVGEAIKRAKSYMACYPEHRIIDDLLAIIERQAAEIEFWKNGEWVVRDEQQRAKIERQAAELREKDAELKKWTNQKFLECIEKAEHEYREAQAEIERLRETLQFYANSENYRGEGLDLSLRPIWADGGNKASFALSAARSGSDG